MIRRSNCRLSFRLASTECLERSILMIWRKGRKKFQKCTITKEEGKEGGSDGAEFYLDRDQRSKDALKYMTLDRRYRLFFLKRHIFE
jgi:hypothetical protein